GQRPTLRVEGALAERGVRPRLPAKDEKLGQGHPFAVFECLRAAGQVAADAALAIAHLHGGDDVADTFGDPLGKGPAAAVDEDMCVLVSGYAEVAARYGGKHDIVAALGADEKGIGARARTILVVLLRGGERDYANFAVRARTDSHLADEEGMQTLQI